MVAGADPVPVRIQSAGHLLRGDASNPSILIAFHHMGKGAVTAGPDRHHPRGLVSDIALAVCKDPVKAGGGGVPKDMGQFPGVVCRKHNPEGSAPMAYTRPGANRRVMVFLGVQPLNHHPGNHRAPPGRPDIKMLLPKTAGGGVILYLQCLPDMVKGDGGGSFHVMIGIAGIQGFNIKVHHVPVVVCGRQGNMIGPPHRHSGDAGDLCPHRPDTGADQSQRIPDPGQHPGIQMGIAGQHGTACGGFCRGPWPSCCCPPEVFGPGQKP